MMFWTSPMKYFYVGFFKASIYFYLFEDFSIVLSIVVFSIGILLGPESQKKSRSRDDRTKPHTKSTPKANLTGPNFIFRFPS